MGASVFLKAYDETPSQLNPDRRDRIFNFQEIFFAANLAVHHFHTMFTFWEVIGKLK